MVSSKTHKLTRNAAGAAAPASTHIAQVGQLFQQVHQSAAHSTRCKKDLLSLCKEDEAAARQDVCDVVLLILRQATQISADALKRHYAFLVELCKGFREVLSSDLLAVDVMKAVLPFHNANEKQIRLTVVSTFESLLKTVDQSNTSEARQDFYQDVAEMLKQRIHDKCPHVRSKAITAVAAFQTGKKDCDVTQQLIALLCTDTNADVRKQILHCIAPRKEFLEGYFHGMIRCTRDVVARVRAEAWDALARFPWRYITAYADAKSVKFPDLLQGGLGDANASVVVACRAALTNCWFHRDCKEVCEDFLSPIACGYVLPSLTPFDCVSRELLHYVRKRKPGTHFHLNLQAVNSASLFMWKADCQASCDAAAAEDEAVELLLPLEQFSAVLQDTVYAYARPDTEPKVVKFRNIEDADNMLRILLSVFEVYDENGYLAHADNTTRASLLRLLNFLLKVVPDDDPSLFVDIGVRALKSLTARTPEEATKTVTSALDSLFHSLKLPQRYGLGYEDVEALGRKSRERHQELVKRRVLSRSGDMADEKYTELKDEMDRDEKFLLRMQLIVLAFLSHSQRGDEIPIFCYHIIQLGRSLDNEKVKVAATKSLGLQCLVNPESVHTFMPLIVADAQEHITDRDAAVPVAAIGVMFDLIMEYGLHFFDAAERQQGSSSAGALYNTENSLEARLQREQELAEEDVHKVGGLRLVGTLEKFFNVGNEGKQTVTACGFCKLLSCNRIPAAVVPRVIAKLLLFYVGELACKKSNPAAAYMSEFVGQFFRGYAASHPKRQEQVMEGGVEAFRFLLAKNPPLAGKLMEHVSRLTDAYSLTLIRDIDPQAAKRATRVSSEEEADSQITETQACKANRSNATNSSMQSNRLMRELSRYSLHERVSECLVCEVALNESREARLICMEVLEKRLYCYSREPQPFLLFCGKVAQSVCNKSDPDICALVDNWMRELASRSDGTSSGSDGAADSTGDMQKKWDGMIAQRNASSSALADTGFTGFASIIATGAGPASDVPGKLSKQETDLKRERDSDFFDVESIIGARKKPRR